MSQPTLITFVLYLLAVFGIGVWAYLATKNLSDYILGGRSLGPAVTALSAGASDMSGWLLLGLPGAVYASGLKEAWIIVGLIIGAYFNWSLVAKRLRVYTEASSDALTLPDYFGKRFNDQKNILKLMSAIVILIFFTFYTASGLVAGAKLFSSSFGLGYSESLMIGATVIVAYTCAGGFLAVSWTDFAQSLLMMFALVAVPIAVSQELGGIGEIRAQLAASKPEHLNLFSGFTVLGFLSLMAWGLGYFGQPHILARFMAIRSPDEVQKATRIGMAWMVLTLVAAVAIGLSGAAYMASGKIAAGALLEKETIFILLTQTVFNPWLAGVLLAGILAAVMSTIDSQLLVSSSAITGDIYQGLFRKNAGEKELVWVSRLTVLLISLCAILIAADPENQVLTLVAYAWAGCGAAFGPVVLVSLFWKDMTRKGALAGMLTGALTVLIWAQLKGGIFDLYELLPGFVFALASIFLVSKMDKDESGIDRNFENIMDRI